MNAVVELEKTREISEYNPFRAQLAELRELNDSIVFDYKSKKGNKEARSHVFKLRQTKSAVDKVRERVKADVLIRGRLIDSEAKEIMGQLETMIEVHQKPLDEIEQVEKERRAKYEEIIDELIAVTETNHSGFTSEAIADRLREVSEVVIDESFAEYMAPATGAKKKAIDFLNNALAAAKQREAEAAELAKLRAEAAERERKDREERIAREAAEKAKAEAEAKAKAEAEAARKAVEDAERAKIQAEAKAKAEIEAARQATEAAERRGREMAEAAQKREAEAKAQAARAAIEAEERVKREAQEKADREAAEQAKREKDQKHKAEINNAARKCLTDLGIAEEVATQVITAIAKGKVKHVSIKY